MSKREWGGSLWREEKFDVHFPFILSSSEQPDRQWQYVFKSDDEFFEETSTLIKIYPAVKKLETF